jgi:hypothetical protein
VSTQILLAVEAIDAGDGPVPSLYDAVDPDALDALFVPRDRTDRASGSVSFTLDDYEIRLRSSGTVVIRVTSSPGGADAVTIP